MRRGVPVLKIETRGARICGWAGGSRGGPPGKGTDRAGTCGLPHLRVEISGTGVILSAPDGRDEIRAESGMSSPSQEPGAVALYIRNPSGWR